MEIIKANNIQTLKSKMLEDIANDIDVGAISKLLKTKYDFNLGGDIQYEKGDVVIKDGEFVYEIDFNIKALLAIILSKDGDILDIESSSLKISEEPQNLHNLIPAEENPQEKKVIETAKPIIDNLPKKEMDEVELMINGISKIVGKGSEMSDFDTKAAEAKRKKQISDTALKLATMIADINN